MSAQSPVTLELTGDTALVLFELLARLDSAEVLVPLFEHKAEQRALWDLEALLGKSLVEPLAPNYEELLAAARERLADER